MALSLYMRYSARRLLALAHCRTSHEQKVRMAPLVASSFVIGAVRIGALWLGAATNYSSGWVQIPGYFLQMMGLPELYLVRGMRATPLKWTIAASTLLMLSSFVWAALLVWVANRLPREASNTDTL